MLREPELEIKARDSPAPSFDLGFVVLAGYVQNMVVSWLCAISVPSLKLVPVYAAPQLAVGQLGM